MLGSKLGARAWVIYLLLSCQVPAHSQYGFPILLLILEELCISHQVLLGETIGWYLWLGLGLRDVFIAIFGSVVQSIGPPNYIFFTSCRIDTSILFRLVTIAMQKNWVSIAQEK